MSVKTQKAGGGISGNKKEQGPDRQQRGKNGEGGSAAKAFITRNQTKEKKAVPEKAQKH